MDLPLPFLPGAAGAGSLPDADDPCPTWGRRREGAGFGRPFDAVDGADNGEVCADGDEADRATGDGGTTGVRFAAAAAAAPPGPPSSTGSAAVAATAGAGGAVAPGATATAAAAAGAASSGEGGSDDVAAPPPSLRTAINMASWKVGEGQ